MNFLNILFITELYEGLSRALRSRLEDQRGTEINFELPDFLKDKENNQINTANGNKLRTVLETHIENSRFYTGDVSQAIRDRPGKITKNDLHSNYENRELLPVADDTHRNNIKNNNTQNGGNAKGNSSSKFVNSYDSTSSSSQPSPTNEYLNKTVIENTSKSTESLNSSKCGDPPPLPPKPKILPIRPSNWGNHGFLKLKDLSRKEVSKHGLYLEQPTSSFV